MLQGRTTAKDGDESSEVSEEECEEDQEGDGPEPVADPNEAVEEAGEGGGDEGRVIEDVGASQAHDEGCEGDGESSDGGCAADACLEDGAVDAAVADEGGVGEVVKPDLSDGDSDDEMPPLEAPAEVDSVVLADDSPPPQHKGSGYNEELFQSPQAGNSGFESEIVEMCIALMEWFSKHNPDMLKILSQFLTQCVFLCRFEYTLPLASCLQSAHIRNYHLPNCLSHCEWAFSRFGIVASSWLSTKEHWDEWFKRYLGVTF